MATHADFLLKMMSVILGSYIGTYKCFFWGTTAYAKTKIFIL